MLMDAMVPMVPCCDICYPSLLDIVRPGKKANADRVTWPAFEKAQNVE